MVVTFPQNWTAIMDDPTGATYAPATYAQATNNLRFCLALGLHEGRVHVDTFDEAHLRAPAVLDIARRVVPRPDAERGRIFETTDRAPTRLEVRLRSGARHELEVDYPRGCPQNPASRAELIAKFEALAGAALPGARLAAVRDAVLDLEAVPRIGDLAGLLRWHPRPS
jgi:2-methylcitrate dehydratase PrpD